LLPPCNPATADVEGEVDKEDAEGASDDNAEDEPPLSADSTTETSTLPACFRTGAAIFNFRLLVFDKGGEGALMTAAPASAAALAAVATAVAEVSAVAVVVGGLPF
jgi:hypothetical protein